MPEYHVRAAVAATGEPFTTRVSSLFTFTATDAFLFIENAAPPLQFDLAEHVAIEPGDETLRIGLLDGQTIQLSALGKMADELVATFTQACCDRTAYCFRFGRALAESWRTADCSSPGHAPRRVRVRLFESLIGVIPWDGEPDAIHYADIRRTCFDEPAYQVVVETHEGATWRFGRLGKGTTPMLEAIKKAAGDFSVRYQTQLENVVPDTPPPRLREFSEQWREGLALPGEFLDRVSPELTARLVDYLPPDDRKPFVGVLRGMADVPALGFYYSAETDGARDNLPFVPYALFPMNTGRALAWENLSEDALATYVFRASGPAAAQEINAALRQIRFAREPVYLSEAELKSTGEHRHHVPLLRRSQALPLLKRQYLGRALHTNLESYSAQLSALAKM